LFELNWLSVQKEIEKNKRQTLLTSIPSAQPQLQPASLAPRAQPSSADGPAWPASSPSHAPPPATKARGPRVIPHLWPTPTRVRSRVRPPHACGLGPARQRPPPAYLCAAASTNPQTLALPSDAQNPRSAPPSTRVAPPYGTRADVALSSPWSSSEASS
jgi:hypothetical protein